MEPDAEQTHPLDDQSASGDGRDSNLPESEEMSATEDGFDFSTLATPEELAPHPGALAQSDLEMPPALDRERPARAPLVPTWVLPALSSLLGVLLIAMIAWFATSAAARVSVPDVTGRSFGLARTVLAQRGLEAAIVERRFSSRPVDQVLDQSPDPGSELAKGDTVRLVVSAGTEEATLPDVIGDGIALARGTLEGLGLVVVVEPVPSEVPSDTVLSTIPSPGSVVRSGDVVRVQVSSPLADETNIEPFDMQGVSVTIDPAMLAGLTPDITLEVSRRLRSLLEASGAKVVVLRGTGTTKTSDSDRAKLAARTTPTLAVGLSATERGADGRRVSLTSGDSTMGPQAQRLADATVKHLTRLAPPAVATSGTADPVLGASKAPWVRVWLGSFSDPADKTAFSDPRWADRVARAIYAAVGEVFGSEEAL